MLKIYRLAPPFSPADFTELGSQIDLLRSLGVRVLYCDIMDDDLVSNISFDMPVLKSTRKKADPYLDAHLTVAKPGRYIDASVETGADSVTVHVEVYQYLDRTVQHIKAYGKEVAIALNSATSSVVVGDTLPEPDMVPTMSANPDFGRQSHILYCMDKVHKLWALADQKHPRLSTQVDNGMNWKTSAEVLAAGADDIVAGSVILGGSTMENVAFFRDVFRQVEVKEKAWDGRR